MNKGKETMIPRHLFAFRLRALVLALGESSNPAWWKTDFMNETGLRFLERIYPRTLIHAAVHASGRAACEAHDRAVGRVGVYHLFRLPEILEVEIQTLPSFGDDEFIGQFRSVLGLKNDLLEMISFFCNSQKSTKNITGPHRIGNESEATTIDGFIRTAEVYRDAFKKGKPVFPYFAAEQNRNG